MARALRDSHSVSLSHPLNVCMKFEFAAIRESVVLVLDRGYKVSPPKLAPHYRPEWGWGASLLRWLGKARRLLATTL
jgi:hypothetical protein